MEENSYFLISVVIFLVLITDILPVCPKAVFLNRRAAALYRALVL
jgi:hypothetical protein